MPVLASDARRNKHVMEELLLLMLRFRCFMSKQDDLCNDPQVMAKAHQLLRRLKTYLPSPEFSQRYFGRLSELGFDGRFALMVDHNMTKVTVIRTSSLANVLQFVRGAA